MLQVPLGLRKKSTSNPKNKIMRKVLKLIWIPLAIALLVLIVYQLFNPDRPYGNKFTMTCTCEVPHGKLDLKQVFFYYDNSGSMKGYTDFANCPDAKKTIGEVTVTGLNNLKDLCSDSCVIRIECGNTIMYDINEYRKKLTTGTLLDGKATELDKLISNAAAQVSDTSIAIVVSDMLLSYGSEKVKESGDNYLNLHTIGELGAGIHATMKDLKRKNMDVVVLQYYSDYNGNYYCNCTENLCKPQNDKAFYCTLMKKRPYYVMIMGNSTTLKNIMSRRAFSRYEHFYTTLKLENNDYKKQPFTIDTLATPWVIGNCDTLMGCICATKKAESYALITHDKFAIPDYVNSDFYVGEHSEHFREITTIKSKDTQKVTYKAALLPYTKKEADTAWFCLVSIDTAWVDCATLENDVKIDNVKKMEKKTWQIATIIKNIELAYFGENGKPPYEVARFNFLVLAK